MNESDEEEFDSDALSESDASSYSEESAPKPKKHKNKTESIAENDKKASDFKDNSASKKLLNKKINKNNNYKQKVEEKDYSSQSEEVVKKTTSSRRRLNLKKDQNLLPLEEIKNNYSARKSTTTKENRAKRHIIIDDEENENEGVELTPSKTNNKDSKHKIHSGKKLITDESKQQEEKKESVQQEGPGIKKAAETNAFMKMLEIKSKDLEKKIEKTDDISKLSLKERLALKASKGNINDFFNAMQNFSTSDILKTNPYSREISNEEVINDLIEKGKKSTEKK